MSDKIESQILDTIQEYGDFCLCPTLWGDFGPIVDKLVNEKVLISIYDKTGVLEDNNCYRYILT